MSERAYYKNKTTQRLYKLLRFIIIAAAVVAMLGLIGYRVYHVSRDASFAVEELNHGWYYYDANGEKQYVAVPGNITVRGKNNLVLYNDDISDYPAGYVLSTMAAVYKPDIIYNGHVLYSYDDGDFERNLQMDSKIYCKAEISNIYEGQPLVIVYRDVTGRGKHGGYTFNVPGVLIGSPGAVFLYNCSEVLISLIIILGLMVTMAGSVIGWLYYRKTFRSIRLLDMALFLGVFTIWCITDLGILQYVLDRSKSIANNYISFIAFMSFMIPVINFAKHTVNCDERFFDRLSSLFIINIFIQLIVNIIFKISLTAMLPVTHGLLIVSAVLLAVKLWLVYQETANSDIIKFLTALCCMGFAGTASLIIYWMYTVYYEGVFQVGVIVGVAYLIYDIFLQLADYKVSRRKFELDNTIHKDMISGLADNVQLEEDLEWLKVQYESDEAGQRSILRLMFGRDSVARDKLIETGFIRVDIELFKDFDAPEEDDPIYKLRRLAVAGLSVRNSFDENASGYCVDPEHLCVITSLKSSEAEKRIRMLRQYVDKYNRMAEHNYDKLRMIVTSRELVL